MGCKRNWKRQGGQRKRAPKVIQEAVTLGIGSAVVKPQIIDDAGRDGPRRTQSSGLGCDLDWGDNARGLCSSSTLNDLRRRIVVARKQADPVRQPVVKTQAGGIQGRAAGKAGIEPGNTGYSVVCAIR